MDSNTLFPIKDFKNTVFLKPLITASEVTNVHAGEYIGHGSIVGAKSVVSSDIPLTVLP